MILNISNNLISQTFIGASEKNQNGKFMNSPTAPMLMGIVFERSPCCNYSSPTPRFKWKSFRFLFNFENNKNKTEKD